MVSLLDFLKNTKVRSKESTAKKIAKWKQNKDQDGKN